MEKYLSTILLKEIFLTVIVITLKPLYYKWDLQKGQPGRTFVHIRAGNICKTRIIVKKMIFTVSGNAFFLKNMKIRFIDWRKPKRFYLKYLHNKNLSLISFSLDKVLASRRKEYFIIESFNY